MADYTARQAPGKAQGAYVSFRKMLDDMENQIDAVVGCTPDHSPLSVLGEPLWERTTYKTTHPDGAGCVVLSGTICS